MDASTPELDRLGGKAANLVRLAAAGLPVPRFVTIPTDEYLKFVDSADLAPVIVAALSRPAAEASDLIRAAFDAADLGVEQRIRLLEAIAPVVSPDADATTVVTDPSTAQEAEPPAVAVRSSATAEDLPGQSFAGQQDTFLSVRGADAVLEAIVECWSSLWTDRAITYRARNEVDNAGVALAVVVQEMVDADASGVLFTANPRTGRRNETVIDAVAGLGDELVSGHVIPDTFELDTETGELLRQSLAGARATMTVRQLQDLTALGRRIVGLYGIPMDIEWARVGKQLHILQARAITSLYPLPDVPPAPAGETQLWFSFGAFQGLLEPITPLGQDMIRMVLGAAPRVIGRRIDWQRNAYVAQAGERLWIRVDDLLRNRLTRKGFSTALPLVDPASAAIVSRIADEPGLSANRPTPRPRTMTALGPVLSRVATRGRASMTDPVAARRHVERTADRLVASVHALVTNTDVVRDPQERLLARVAAMEATASKLLPTMLPAFGPVMAPSILSLVRLREAARHTGLPDADALAMNVMRALPGNVTTEMDLALSDVAEAIKKDATAWGWVAETSAEHLARQFEHGNLPRAAQNSIAAFLDQYGVRGVAEIDLGAPRWRDDPTPVMHTLKAYVSTSDDAPAPRTVHAEGQNIAGRSVRTLMDASSRTRAQRIRRYALAIRGMFGARETPKFAIIRAFGLLREALDDSARDLVAAGRLGSASDIYFLHTDELRHAFSSDWHEVVASRKGARAVEARRGQVPRILVSDGRTFYEGLAADGEPMGMGVSPGVAEGPVRVVRDPRSEQLRPGEILVCAGTDPAWTPLFLTAAGLVTEVGGLMTHGSVVAREYGIPAVVGVHEATTRLTDGQRIRIDGTSGAIEIL